MLHREWPEALPVGTPLYQGTMHSEKQTETDLHLFWADEEPRTVSREGLRQRNIFLTRQSE